MVIDNLGLIYIIKVYHEQDARSAHLEAPDKRFLLLQTTAD